MPKAGHFLVACIALYPCLTGSGKQVAGSHTGTVLAVAGEQGKPAPGKELIRDARFRQGFSLSPLTPEEVMAAGSFDKAHKGYYYFEEKDKKPVWEFCQWASKHSLEGAGPKKNADNSVEYRNAAKRILRYTDGTLHIGVFTSREYTRPREAGGAFTGFLIQQDFRDPPNIGDVNHLYFSAAIKIVACKQKMKKQEYNPDIHTAQTPMYFILKNKNPQSEDYNYAIWLGIQSFDYRYPEMNSKEEIGFDKDTHMYIYNIPQTRIWGKKTSFNDHRWHQTQTDLLPSVLQAVAAMRAKGAFLNSALSDLVLEGMNFGWECPGTFDVALEVRGLSLKVVDKNQYGLLIRPADKNI
ncbi:hypothetical protein LQ567_12930 [Niabella pedocola]|uniref:Uncharacterized protein n=1 Tax=Niabella pedocola TaxID=1752077 RepID=A0ABS8PRH0_9BACT|nr:hypothetical protein [Niabella pedocola]MCD2423673.1 hypothetical protein [Niabella pedocola]